MVRDSDQTKTRRRGFIQRDRRGNLILLLAIVLVAGIIIAVLSLLPGRYPNIGDNHDNGVGRDFMFPFVFLDGEGTLRVIRDESLQVYDIDDTVSQSIHDSDNGFVYYVREHILYRYTVDQNSRTELVGSVAAFALTEQRDGIFIEDTERNLKVYDGVECHVISENQEALPATFYSVGASQILFLEDYSAHDGTARLCRADSNGTVYRYSFRVNAEKTFAFTHNGEQICYYSEDDFCVAKLSGELIQKFASAMPIQETQQATILNATTQMIDYNRSIPTHYIVTALSSQHDSDAARRLMYFNGSQCTEIAVGVVEILYYSKEQDMILFTGTNQDGSVTVYRSAKGSYAQAQLSCRADTKFLFDEDLDYLYYQLSDGALYRYNIYDSNRKSVKVAADTGLLYLYPNKPFAIYMSTDSTQVYLVHSDNSIQRYAADSEWRMYGEQDDQYLHLRAYGADRISLDYVVGDSATRLCSDVEHAVFFDKQMSYVLYTSKGRLYAWHENNAVKIGDYAGVQAVSIVA